MAGKKKKNPSPASSKQAEKSKGTAAPSSAGTRAESLRSILLKKRKDIISNTQEEVSKYIKGENRQLVENATDGGDFSVMDLSEDLRLQILGANHDTIIKIDEALRKLEEGTYGMCEDCEEEISAERLKILPFAIRCRDCQELEEERLAAEKGESIIY